MVKPVAALITTATVFAGAANTRTIAAEAPTVEPVSGVIARSMAAGTATATPVVVRQSPPVVVDSFAGAAGIGDRGGNYALWVSGVGPLSLVSSISGQTATPLLRFSVGLAGFIEYPATPIVNLSASSIGGVASTSRPVSPSNLVLFAPGVGGSASVAGSLTNALLSLSAPSITGTVRTSAAVGGSLLTLSAPSIGGSVRVSSGLGGAGLTLSASPTVGLASTSGPASTSNLVLFAPSVGGSVSVAGSVANALLSLSVPSIAGDVAVSGSVSTPQLTLSASDSPVVATDMSLAVYQFIVI